MADNNLIEDYLLSFANTQTTDYQIKSSVAKHNRAMNKCRKIASEIQTNYPELKESFAQLLDKYPEGSSRISVQNVCRINVVSSDAIALRDPFSFLRVRANKGNELPRAMKALAMAIKDVPLLLHGNP